VPNTVRLGSAARVRAGTVAQAQSATVPKPRIGYLMCAKGPGV
jgi:hypothetical protein